MNFFMQVCMEDTKKTVKQEATKGTKKIDGNDWFVKGTKIRTPNDFAFFKLTPKEGAKNKEVEVSTDPNCKQSIGKHWYESSPFWGFFAGSILFSGGVAYYSSKSDFEEVES